MSTVAFLSVTAPPERKPSSPVATSKEPPFTWTTPSEWTASSAVSSLNRPPSRTTPAFPRSPFAETPSASVLVLPPPVVMRKVPAVT